MTSLLRLIIHFACVMSLLANDPESRKSLNPESFWSRIRGPQLSDYQDPLAIVGRGDLDPLGRSGGGMLVDPRQFPTAHQPFNPSAGIPGQLPRGSIPPGARFDPFAPPDPDIHPNNAPRPRGPNPDHMKPPGFDDMFS